MESGRAVSGVVQLRARPLAHMPDRRARVTGSLAYASGWCGCRTNAQSPSQAAERFNRPGFRWAEFSSFARHSTTKSRRPAIVRIGFPAYTKEVWSSGKSGEGLAMKLRAKEIRVALVAVAATVVMLSMAVSARAESSSSARRGSGRSCCVNRVCPAGCCVAGAARASDGTKVCARLPKLQSDWW